MRCICTRSSSAFRSIAYAEEIAALRALPAKIHPKICEPDAQLARGLGLPYVGGDVFLDGSIGSRTAALCERYADAATCGALRFSDDQLLAYYAQAEALGIAAGVHAIGDAAIEQSVRVWERVLAGKPSPRGCRHFIEHFELATQEHIDACARMGIYLSMQPQFDALWAGRGGMYETRLGERRKRSMNAFARIEAAGATLCGGDDSPVCELNPLAGMQASVEHHETAEALARQRALAMYTTSAARFGYAESETGNLEARTLRRHGRARSRSLRKRHAIHAMQRAGNVVERCMRVARAEPASPCFLRFAARR